MKDNTKFTILYGDVLSVFGVPQDFPLLNQFGSKIFDKRTKLYRQATKIRREQLKKEYGL